MLKNIRLHIEEDDEKQASLDKQLAQLILDTHKSNINAFRRNIPTVLPYIDAPKPSTFSLFMNKFSEVNIVDYGVGRTFYGFHPQNEVLQHLEQAEKHSPRIDLNQASSPSADKEPSTLKADSNHELKYFEFMRQHECLPKDIECLVILGCGLGLHLAPLVRNHKIKNLIIYEPEIQYFQCSVMSTSWHEIFQLAKSHNTSIFLQLEKDGRDIVNDIVELKQHAAISSFYIYKHYSHQVFDAIYRDLINRSWAEIQDRGLMFSSENSYLDYVPVWTTGANLDVYQPIEKLTNLFERNMKAFKHYFPDVHEQFKDHRPQKWQPISSPEGEINLIKTDTGDSWYGESPKQDCYLNLDNFSKQPNKDGLVLGYSGEKLAHYLHFQFVKETEELLTQAKEEIGALPEDIASLIMFGIGVGYQIEKLLENHSVEKLFICEPNPDFFYASLYAIDWQAIFDTIDEAEGRIYLNIGDDGTNLFRDLLGQFQSIGAYILNNTYFYQSYYNASLNSAIAQLREQLQIVISMGEHFDHAFYGISHTKEVLSRKYPALTKDPESKLSYDEKEVPVFIVGNGPSLDQTIAAIKEWKEHAIIISCGTALQALYRHNITPDFHTEIEQNRSTFDWPVLIGDLDYLKQITLVSCNGIHPDTCKLYKDVLIVFKEGESSTVSALRILGENNFEALQHAFPTVSNFSCNLFSRLGFSSIYLLGVDLGFVDVNHHHSKASGYYEDNGKEIYDYSKTSNTSLSVPGNFRAMVNTKQEFKLSRQMIEQVTASKSNLQSFYNCSDGARIQGALPLPAEDIFITTKPAQKSAAIKRIKTEIFETEQLNNFIERYDAGFSHDLLLTELDAFEQLITQSLNDGSDINQLIEKQRKMLFASYQHGKSLLFYYLYGTVNYANALFTKLSSNQGKDCEIKELRDIAKNKWLSTFGEIKGYLKDSSESIFDTSGYNTTQSDLKLLELNYQNELIVFIVESKNYKEAVTCMMREHYAWFKNIQILSFDESKELELTPHYSVYFVDKLPQEDDLLKGSLSTIVFSDSFEKKEPYPGVSFLLSPPLSINSVLRSPIFMTRITIMASLQATRSKLIIPKFWAGDDSQAKDNPVIFQLNGSIAYSYLHYVCIYNEDETRYVDTSRGRRIQNNVHLKHVIYKYISKEDIESFEKAHSDRVESVQ
jgi:hypothetical protein